MIIIIILHFIFVLRRFHSCSLSAWIPLAFSWVFLFILFFFVVLFRFCFSFSFDILILIYQLTIVHPNYKHYTEICKLINSSSLSFLLHSINFPIFHWPFFVGFHFNLNSFQCPIISVWAHSRIKSFSLCPPLKHLSQHLTVDRTDAKGELTPRLFSLFFAPNFHLFPFFLKWFLESGHHITLHVHVNLTGHLQDKRIIRLESLKRFDVSQNTYRFPSPSLLFHSSKLCSFGCCSIRWNCWSSRWTTALMRWRL